MTQNSVSADKIPLSPNFWAKNINLPNFETCSQLGFHCSSVVGDGVVELVVDTGKLTWGGTVVTIMAISEYRMMRVIIRIIRMIRMIIDMIVHGYHRIMVM